MIRAVVDTNVVVSGLLTPAGPAARVLEAAGLRFHLVWTPAIVAECHRVLAYPKVARLLAHRESYARGVVAALAELAVMVAPELLPAIRVVPADPSDDVFVAAALAGGARFVVSGDRRHLLALGEYAGIRVLAPAEFLEALERPAP